MTTILIVASTGQAVALGLFEVVRTDLGCCVAEQLMREFATTGFAVK